MIYENVKELAEQNNLSIRKVEAMAGLKNGTIGKWRNVSPMVDNLQKVADVFGVTVSRLLYGKDKGA